MSESVSALDGDYVRLGRVAALVAQERQQCAFDDVMDLLKQAVFAGEFDPPPFEVGDTREDPRNWLHMEVEATAMPAAARPSRAIASSKTALRRQSQHGRECVAHDRRAPGREGPVGAAV